MGNIVGSSTASFAEAIALEEHAIALDPDDPWIRQKAMAIYLDLGDEAAARDVAAGTPRRLRTGRNCFLPCIGVIGAQPGWLRWVIHRGMNTTYLTTGRPARRYATTRSERVNGTRPVSGFWKTKYNLSKNPHETSLGLENFRQAFYLSQLLAARRSGYTERSKCAMPSPLGTMPTRLRSVAFMRAACVLACCRQTVTRVRCTVRVGRLVPVR